MGIKSYQGLIVGMLTGREVYTLQEEMGIIFSTRYGKFNKKKLKILSAVISTLIRGQPDRKGAKNREGNYSHKHPS